MFIIKFPHRVKIDQDYYPPNTLIEVVDATKHVEAGAVIIREEVTAPKPSKPVAKRTKKVATEE